MYAMLLLRTGKTVGMEELTRLAARRGDVVGTVALLVFLGVSLKKVTNVNKILKKGTRPYGLMDAIHGHFDIMTSAQIDKRHFNIFVQSYSMISYITFSIKFARLSCLTCLTFLNIF